ncbi:MAG: nitronate monooxygenase [Alphaproteobacteria bacterium]|nr:nitronate monooxygenase [Alphaproteobacteria bacterium]
MTTGSTKLNELWARGCDFLGSTYAIMGGAMTWVSERHLVAAISNAGGFGVIASGSMNPAQLDEEIKSTKKLTSRSFGVNIIIMHPLLDDLIKVCLNHKISHIVLAGGIPQKSTIYNAKQEKAKVICFAPALGIAKKLIKSGVDGLVIEGMEAGGHIGPVSTSVLAQEILPHITEVPVFVAGGIGRGEMIAHYLGMGAAGVQLGTRFVCATESIAHIDFKKAFIKANARDAIPSVQVDPRFPVIPVRALSNKATEQFILFQHTVIKQFNEGLLDQKEAQLKIEHFWAGALRKAVIEGDIENGSIMAGQSVGMVDSIMPTKDILNELIDQAIHALTKDYIHLKFSKDLEQQKVINQ